MKKWNYLITRGKRRMTHLAIFYVIFYTNIVYEKVEL